MSAPKRHHWWPQLQSGFWCDDDGLINVLRPDGSKFRSKPLGLGVVGHLYSKELENGGKDAAIETWFANEIDGPFSDVLNYLLNVPRIRTKLLADPGKAKTIESLGYRARAYSETIKISADQRQVMSSYIAALVVRNPEYLSKLEEFHRDLPKPKNYALENMQHIYEIYADRIKRADFIIVEADGSHEFIFSDGGIVAKEPWSESSLIPFDIHFPLTPKLALQILPVGKPAFPDRVHIIGASNKAISVHNRISLQYAKEQVFYHTPPELSFVMKNWGRAAPEFIGKRDIDGELETKVDWSRFYY